MQSEQIFLAVAVAVILATVGLVLTGPNHGSRMSTVFLAVAIGGISVLVVAAAALLYATGD